jgi:hypothetical protein
MEHVCGICGNKIDRSLVLKAIELYPYRVAEDEITAYHLDCAVSDGSWIKASEVDADMESTGVYLIEEN